MIVSESFKVDDPPNILDENLPAVANVISTHLNDSPPNFHRFGVSLLSNKKAAVKLAAIQLGNNLNNEGFQGTECLELIKLWIKSTPDAQWEQLIKAAKEAALGRLETALTTEFTIPAEPDYGNLMCTDSYCLHMQHK